MAAVILERTTCRICAASLAPIFSLGSLYLSDFPASAGSHVHPPVPLDLMRCTAEDCGLVQLAHTTPPDWLYTETYWYRSGVNETMRAELRDLVKAAVARVALPAHATVIDIGANDGTLLAQYAEVLPKSPLLKVAYEPAASHYAALRPHAQVLFPTYFTAKAGDYALPQKAKIITAIAMFYDLDDPHAFVESLTHALHPDGVIVIQQAYLFAMLATTDITNVCHEHLEYYHLRPLEQLLGAHGLEVVDVERRAINGGSFRAWVQFAGKGKVNPRVAQMRAEEERLLAIEGPFLGVFVQRALAMRTQLQALVGAYQHQGAILDLYAASTKANTLLQWCGIDARQIRQAWERTPEKIGRYVGVSGIPIVDEPTGRADPPAALLCGAWSFRDAFLRREHAYLDAGGRLIFPLPHVEVVEQRILAELAKAARA